MFSESFCCISVARKLLCTPQQQDSSHNSRFCCFPGSTLSTGHGWASALVELHLVGNVFPTSQILTCLSSTSTHVNIPLFNSQTKECKKLSCFGLYQLPLVKANTVATLSYLQVTGLQSSVFLNLPHHCLEKRKCLFIRVKKNVLAASKTTAL